MMRFYPLGFACVCLFAQVLPARAVVTHTLEFDLSPPAPGTQVGFGSYAEDGFTVKPLGPLLVSTPFHLRRNGGGSAGFPDNGSAYLQLSLGDSLEVFHDFGEAFTPVSIDLAEYSELFASPMLVGFTGYFASGPPVTVTFMLDGLIDGTGPLADFETFLFPASFQNIILLESTTNFFSADNLVVELVPEPGRMLLTMTGLLAMASRRRRTIA